MATAEPQARTMTQGDAESDSDVTYSLPAMSYTPEPLVWVPFTESDLELLDRLAKAAESLRRKD